MRIAYICVRFLADIYIMLQYIIGIVPKEGQKNGEPRSGIIPTGSIPGFCPMILI